jgi:hypothetical protein
VRGLAIGAVALGGMGLFGTGVHGLVQVDGELADATGRPAAREVKRELEPKKDDCPWLEREHRFDRRRL